MRIEKILIVSNSIISIYSKHTSPLFIRLTELLALNSIALIILSN